jgi:hypothetical protein
LGGRGATTRRPDFYGREDDFTGGHGRSCASLERARENSREMGLERSRLLFAVLTNILDGGLILIWITAADFE